ncbi:hypothetical protein PTSG_09735 [Salpingoeca rosetta]|uniref:Uncharacterized protein n=1 Tax=Salpingoeca rosetta (strain ATCC 50818 / BSB-021) TaxID=946362 RepID=F2UNW6_SALR5|nr:uncharacterized protein PTSG_09735 [Salpingoeca rosetta]EGD79321.1 hypothetical protein PTSG_09735 [Salpingoeca rosetta]|eukprot:XP_004989090.1 hypothetical protein PTSG_09735 [Salpingoeca rosetta]
MSTSLKKTTQVIGTVFERTEKILDDAGLLGNSDVAMQLAAYRNYNVDADQLLQVSGWEQNPLALRQFLFGLKVNGGWGNEAIEVALHRANTEKDVSQVILIGDAPANSPDEVASKRNSKGERYWSKFPEFAKSTTAAAELQKLKEKGIPVHAFFIDPRAKNFFRHAAQMTGGRCEFLDIEKASRADQLTNLVSEELLRRVGGDDLVNTYRATFCK